MRLIALLGLTLTLGGCGFNTWWNPPFTTGFDPNQPQGDSANLRRIMGDPTAAEPLMTETGNIWPGPLPPTPTLQDLQDRGLTGDSVFPAPHSSPGSSVPPASAYMPQAPRAAVPAGLPSPSSPGAAPPPRERTGQVYNTPSGPVVTTGGTAGYQTTTLPGGGTGVIVPNGNGTSTIIRSDGRVETIQTPR